MVGLFAGCNMSSYCKRTGKQMNKQTSLLCGDGLPGEVTLGGIRRDMPLNLLGQRKPHERICIPCHTPLCASAIIVSRAMSAKAAISVFDAAR